MHIRIACATALTIAALAAPMMPFAASLNAKPGAWEMTTTTVTAGMSIPADALAKMPAEQRARMEAALQARAGRNSTQVHKSCVTQDDLDQSRMLKSENDGRCSRKVTSALPGKVVMEQVCPVPQPSISRITMEAPSTESLVASIDINQGTRGTVHVDIKGRWLTASCAGIKNGE
jgi:Protein of unknown function (DUF3617)